MRPFADERIDPKLCLFEFVYFARPDTQLYGQSVHQARVRMGEQLAEQAPVEADMVMAVPESGMPAAEGYARRSGIPYGEGLVKNRYVGRTFIAPSQELRARGVRMKLNPLRENIAGKRLVVVDDSIVRGTTHAADRRDAARGRRGRGAPADHRRRPYRWPCFYGMDTGERGELLAAEHDGRRDPRLPRRRLARLPRSRPARRRPTGAVGAGFCDACFTGRLPGAGAGRRCASACSRTTPCRPAARRRRDRRSDDRRPAMGETYEDAGVDIAAGEEAVERIKAHVRSTFRPEVIGDIGGFGGLFAFDAEPLRRTRCSCRRPTASAPRR